MKRPPNSRGHPLCGGEQQATLVPWLAGHTGVRARHQTGTNKHMYGDTRTHPHTQWGKGGGGGGTRQGTLPPAGTSLSQTCSVGAPV